MFDAGFTGQVHPDQPTESTASFVIADLVLVSLNKISDPKDPGRQKMPESVRPRATGPLVSRPGFISQRSKESYILKKMLII